MSGNRKAYGQPLRLILLLVCVTLVIGAFYIQYNWMNNSTETKKREQAPLLEHWLEEGELKVLMTQLKDNEVYLVEYTINPSTYQFMADNHRKLEFAVQEIEVHDGEVYIKRNDQWLMLSKDLRTIEETQREMAKKDQRVAGFSVEVIGKKEYHTRFMMNDKLVWEDVFEQRPAQIVPVIQKPGTYMVLYENFKFEILQT
ncbi:hypothetical protein N781_09780 [Pontibacillus halophilus JSM 076056 = DSM 19796]|uniref:Uncharacterized protein n=1 Tax=Pontibacillus halophilus JSM 076056 = DSM 19796 TaxID=1385510 RepID=A0A0A5ICP1_9BACI|nr:hypothetical protein [Pontibacillus halophilus]KGX93607.1 hypothetical protein N781_09780 [Pontibacillus halophilus JSM 076056 = DSM 19796]